jgi:hypothetical protein
MPVPRRRHWLPWVWPGRLLIDIEMSGQTTSYMLVRTFEIDHVTTTYAHCVLHRAAPRLRDFPPRREFADRARFVAYDEAQHRDDVPCIRPTTHRYLVRPIHFQHSKQQARLSLCGCKHGKRAERELKVRESRDRRCVRVCVGGCGGDGVVFLLGLEVMLP